MPPALTEIVPSGRPRIAGFAAGAAFPELDAPDAVLTGEMCAMAEPGRAGRFLVDSVAFFWANMASRRLGLLDIVLLDIPRPGLGASGFLGELGLLGSLLSSFCAVGSKSSMMLE
jgi:hypothetical protein